MKPRDPERFRTKQASLHWLSEAHGHSYDPREVYRVAYDPTSGFLYVQWKKEGPIESFETVSLSGECEDDEVQLFPTVYQLA